MAVDLIGLLQYVPVATLSLAGLDYLRLRRHDELVSPHLKYKSAVALDSVEIKNYLSENPISQKSSQLRNYLNLHQCRGNSALAITSVENGKRLVELLINSADLDSGRRIALIRPTSAFAFVVDNSFDTMRFKKICVKPKKGRWTTYRISSKSNACSYVEKGSEFLVLVSEIFQKGQQNPICVNPEERETGCRDPYLICRYKKLIVHYELFLDEKKYKRTAVVSNLKTGQYFDGVLIQ